MKTAAQRRALRRAMDCGAKEELRHITRGMNAEELREFAQDLGAAELVCLLDILSPLRSRKLIELVGPATLAMLRECAWEFFLSETNLEMDKEAAEIRSLVRHAPTLALHEIPEWNSLLPARGGAEDGTYLYVTLDGHLAGSIHLLELLDSAPRIQPCSVRVCCKDPMPAVLRLVHRGGFEELPVLNPAGQFTGVIARTALLRAVCLSGLCGREGFSVQRSIAREIYFSVLRRWIPCAGVAALIWHLLKKHSGA